MHPVLRRSLGLLAAAATSAGSLFVLAPANATAADFCSGATEPVYRAVNPTSTAQLLTRTKTEYTDASKFGFTDARGVFGNAAAASATGLSPVTRMYNAKTADFVWMATATEVKNAAAYGYVAQKVDFYAPTAASSCTVAVHRFLKGDHRRNAWDAAEMKSLASAGWSDYGVSFYLKSATATTATSTTPTPTPTPTPTTGTTVSSTGFPDASTTGVPAGTSLTRRDGDITITTDGTVLENLDIHGFVTVRAKNVTIRNSIVRGGVQKGYQTGLITNYGYANLLIENVDVKAEYPSVYFDGIKGSDFTARRVHVTGNVDSVKIHGNNVTITDSLLENTVYYASDPAQNGGPTHNDNIQILKGTNLKITGNTIRGATNFAILGGAEQGAVTLTATSNYLDGGHCTVKLQTKNGWAETSTVSNNTFGPNRAVSSCPFTAYPAVDLTATNNKLWNGNTVTPLILVS